MMNTRGITDKILKYWWAYTLISLSVIGAYILMEIKNVHLAWLENILGYVFLLTAILQLAALVISLFRRRFLVALCIFLGGLVNFYAFMMLAFMLWMLQGENDDFGQRHPIPAGMVCQEPNESFCVDDVDSTFTSSWLRIQKDSQGGIYDYQYFSKSLPDGYIYLKCYEATENILLSEDRMMMKTKVNVKQHDCFGPVGGYCVFTIYEGSWGDYYPVRVEVWHHSEKTGKDQMLTSKIYKMEGWQK